jgi:uncharacterized protein (DUF58 family)
LAPFSWWPSLILIFLVSLFTQVYPLAVFTLMLLIISGFAHWWKRHALDAIGFQRKFVYLRGYPGETLPMQVEIENRKFLPLPWLRLQDNIPNAVGPEDESLLVPTHMPDVGMLTTLFSLRWYERDKRQFTLLLRKRGVYHLGPSTIESGDLFGLFVECAELVTPDFLTVFPEKIPFGESGLPSQDPFGDQSTRRRLYEDPTRPMGVRDYHPEDDFRRINWPVTAHTGSLQVKVYQPISAQVLVVCLNVMTLPHYWEGTDPTMLEYLVKACATITERALQDGYRVGMVSNSSLAHADQPFRVEPGRSRGQLARLLTALASVTPFVTGTFDRFLLAEVPRLPYGASLLIVTAIVDDDLIQALIRLKQHNRRIILLSFAQKVPPELPGIIVYHRPYQS